MQKIIWRSNIGIIKFFVISLELNNQLTDQKEIATVNKTVSLEGMTIKVEATLSYIHPLFKPKIHLKQPVLFIHQICSKLPFPRTVGLYCKKQRERGALYCLKLFYEARK